MYRAGLLILSQPLSISQKYIPAILTEVSQIIKETLYVHIQTSAPKLPLNGTVAKEPCSKELQTYILDFYSKTASLCLGLDVRILLGHVSNSSLNQNQTHRLLKGYDTVVLDNNEENHSEILKNVKKYYLNELSNIPIHNLKTCYPEKKYEVDSEASPTQMYDYVALGGTFDRLHVGHKVLLSEGCLLCKKKFTVGVTDGDMNKKKVLVELIQDIEERKGCLREFINDIKPQIEANVVPIHDVFGPTITDPSIEMIILSEEVKKGAAMINEERKKRGMKELKEDVIYMLDDPCHSASEDTKVSSSSLRRRLLGTLYHPVKPCPNIASTPYRIGLTGGTCSGKSTICKKLEKLGAGIIDCDKLGHEAYKKDTVAYEAIINHFGKDILTDMGEIDRKKLAPIVFSDKAQLEKLNGMVWPEIAKLAEKKIDEYNKEGIKVVVLDAAVLLEAGWNKMVHEVWTSIVPQTEAVKRLIERNSLNEEEASKRVQSQLSNQDRVNQSNVILCSLWEYEYTQSQVDKAWKLLQSRITS